MYRYRDCHQIERMIIHSDGGIDIRFRDPRPDHAHSSRSAVAHVGSMGPTTPRARPALSPRQVKKNKRAADHQAALAAVAASRSTSSTTNGVPPSVPSDGAPTATPAPVTRRPLRQEETLMPCVLMCHHLLWTLSHNTKASPLPARRVRASARKLYSHRRRRSPRRAAAARARVRSNRVL